MAMAKKCQDCGTQMIGSMCPKCSKSKSNGKPPAKGPVPPKKK